MLAKLLLRAVAHSAECVTVLALGLFGELVESSAHLQQIDQRQIQIAFIIQRRVL
jgi:hypothetical protein